MNESCGAPVRGNGSFSIDTAVDSSRFDGELDWSYRGPMIL